MPLLESDVWGRWKGGDSLAAADGGTGSGPGDVVAFAVSSSTIGPEDPARLADFVQAMGLTMTVIGDYDTTIYDEWRFATNEAFAPYPREYVIGRDGLIRLMSPVLDGAAMNAAVQAALQE